MVNRESAERAVKDANPIIDGRKANVNLAYLGAKPRHHVPTSFGPLTTHPLFYPAAGLMPGMAGLAGSCAGPLAGLPPAAFITPSTLELAATAGGLLTLPPPPTLHAFPTHNGQPLHSSHVGLATNHHAQQSHHHHHPNQGQQAQNAQAAATAAAAAAFFCFAPHQTQAAMQHLQAGGGTFGPAHTPTLSNGLASMNGGNHSPFPHHHQSHHAHPTSF